MEITNLRQITSANGKLYAGMTSEEAKQQGVYKKFFQRDFNNIDINHDNVLSVDEILAEREYSVRENKSMAAIWGALSLLDLVGDRGSKMFYIDIIINAAIIAAELITANRTEEGTKRMKEMIKGTVNKPNFEVTA